VVLTTQVGSFAEECNYNKTRRVNSDHRPD